MKPISYCLVYDCPNPMCEKRWTIFGKSTILKGVYCWDCNTLMPGATYVIKHYSDRIDRKLEMDTTPLVPPTIH